LQQFKSATYRAILNQIETSIVYLSQGGNMNIFKFGVCLVLVFLVSACVVVVAEGDSTTPEEEASQKNENSEDKGPAEAKVVPLSKPIEPITPIKATPISTEEEQGSGETDKDKRGRLVVGKDSCKTDADCVPAECCHPKSCVAKTNAPQCEGSRCTLILLSNTMDGGGSCLCYEGKCAAQLPKPLIVPKS
jgi:hypothetical protein